MSLMVLGAFLAVVGACDLLRADRDRTSPVRQAVMVSVGAVLLAGFLHWAAASLAGAVVVGGCLILALAAWIFGSSAALVADGPVAARWRLVAFAGLGGGVAVSILGAGILYPWVIWPSWLDRTVLASWPAADVTVSVGAVLLQLATGNLLVRLFLDTLGVPAGPEGSRFGGGRILGPMERIIIVGLGHIGEVTAAAIVVAVKGLLRLPARQAPAGEGGAEVTERFLVGSFVSWLIGLAGVALIYVA